MLASSSSSSWTRAQLPRGEGRRERVRPAREKEKKKKRDGCFARRFEKKNDGAKKNVSTLSALSLCSILTLSLFLFFDVFAPKRERERRYQAFFPFFFSKSSSLSKDPARRHAGGKQRRDDQLQQQQACADVVGFAKGDDDDGDGDGRKDAAPEPLAMRPRRCCRCI